MIKKVLKSCKLLESVKSLQNKSQTLKNMSGGEKSLAVFNCEKSIVVCNNFVSISEIKKNLEALGKSVSVVSFVPSLPVKSVSVDNSFMHDFIKTLFDFKTNKTNVMMISSESLLCKLPNLDFFDNVISFEKNNSYEFTQIEKMLTDFGYSRQNYANKKGTFSVRGDIVDVFPINEELPIRLDFFGDVIENINYFDAEDMKTYDALDKIEIYPATLYIVNQFEKHLLESNFEKQSEIVKQNHSSKLNDLLIEYSGKIKNNVFDCFDTFLQPFFEFKNNILNLFENATVFFDEPKKIFDDLYIFEKNNNASIKNFIESGELLPIFESFFESVENLLSTKNFIAFDSYNSTYLKADVEHNFRTVGARNYMFDFKALVSDLKSYLSTNQRVVLCCGSVSSQNSVFEFLVQNKINCDKSYNEHSFDKVFVLSDYLPSSASFLESYTIIIGTDDLVKKTNIYKSNKLQKKTNFYLPKINEYVVHAVHGVGKCVSISKLNLNGTEKDYFVIEYKNGDKFYLPSEQANSISAFMGADKEPSLNKIGGQEFGKIKQKVKDSVKELAINLVALYKERENRQGFVYSSGNYLMDEFENAFKYELTHDQAQAVFDIKNDMYSQKVMDRLICGDVGYGKTEVALRAAYQAVLDNKQVAFLCPTTILSEQHFSTTKSRTANFMCNVQVLNRFRSKSQQDVILKQLKEGEVDIICGTHRLLSSDVVFKDLGLLILDEEHRFGVADKEKIKELKKDVDVLTLSATPIPRTLNMAMTGIRDISIIGTPPKNRIPVQTYVTEQSDNLISDACKRELSRNGQVLIVFNRVEHIYAFADKIRQLVPSARVGVAHGQMPERALEDSILKLYNGEYDIFVATTLIENGIDLPMANTLIIIDSDKFGLSQLYQLKGRIGRSDRLGYAYFTYSKSKSLTQDAYKRLDAIVEFSELGSGFKIAMRDLEIRGAGNVLGKQQHGHMQKVGYDLYCKILDETISEISGEKIKQKNPVKVDILCDAYLPESYILGEQQRIKMYSEISEISTREELEFCFAQSTKSFGQVPKQLEHLMKIALIKNCLQMLNVKRIFVDGGSASITFYDDSSFQNHEFLEVVSKYKNTASLKLEKQPIISFEIADKKMDDKLDFFINLLLQLVNVNFHIEK